ncbi:MAG: lysogenization regulator HflD [Kangiella sp.]|nr:MAG: lysogenization regulator HflD [Kangiella sp.]
MNQSSIDQAIALAGLAQSIRVVQNIAWKGETNETDFKGVLSSILTIDSDSAAAVYGGSFEVSTGLRIIKQQLDVSSQKKDPEFINLAINLLTLHKQVMANVPTMDRLMHGIEEISCHFSDGEIYQDEDLYNSFVNDCSSLYSRSISKLPNRIQVKGEPKFLEKEKNQRKVRAALLCAIRSAFLWRQSGGSRWHFLFKKKVILDSVNYLINNPIRK